MKSGILLPYVLGLVVPLSFARAQAGAPPAGLSSAQWELVFQSGFEGDSRVVPSEHGSGDHLVGRDSSLPSTSDWVADLAPFARTPLSINYTGGTVEQRFARVITEPGRPENHVLQFWAKDAWTADESAIKSRVQVDLYKIQGGLKEFYQSVRVFLHPDLAALTLYPRRISWLTIAEFWNNEWWVKTEPHGFRITLGIGKPGTNPQDLIFILNAEDAGYKEVWRGHNSTTKVPIGRWFTLECYFKEGNADHGRFLVSLTPEGEPRQVVFDITHFTHHTRDPHPDGLTGYNPMKMYTSKEVVRFLRDQNKALQIYWDDFRLWRAITP